MNKDKKKQRTVDGFIQSALRPKVSPLYSTAEVDGVIIKHYHFIVSHSKMHKEEFPAKNIEQVDYSLLSVYKRELENQLELNREYCIDQYTVIKFYIRNWLEDKFEKAGYSLYLNEPLDLSKEEREQLSTYGRQIRNLIFSIYRGKEVENIKSDLKKSSASQKVGITPRVSGQERKPIVFNILEVVDKINMPLKNIERVVSRSVDLYFEYVNIQSYLYDLNPEEVLTINKLDNLIKEFVCEKFNPTHDEQMIEDYLKRWERNQGASFSRKVTVDELEKDYPKLAKIYDSSSGVIKNWEDKWKIFKNARTVN